MLRIMDNMGWQMTFPNGWTVSVIMGKGAYCANKGDEELNLTSSKPSPNAEIAAWHGDGDSGVWHKFAGVDDTVLGWQEPLEILKFINMIANKKG